MKTKVVQHVQSEWMRDWKSVRKSEIVRVRVSYIGKRKKTLKNFQVPSFCQTFRHFLFWSIFCRFWGQTSVEATATTTRFMIAFRGRPVLKKSCKKVETCLTWHFLEENIFHPKSSDFFAEILSLPRQISETYLTFCQIHWGWSLPKFFF